jgi:hypothetical protein
LLVKLLDELLSAGHPWAFVGLIRSLDFPIPGFLAMCTAFGGVGVRPFRYVWTVYPCHG